MQCTLCTGSDYGKKESTTFQFPCGILIKISASKADSHVCQRKKKEIEDEDDGDDERQQNAASSKIDIVLSSV